MTYYEITLRVSEEIVREFAEDLPDDRPVSEEVLRSLGDVLRETAQDMTNIYSDNSATTVSVSGPRRERGKVLTDEPGGPLREIDKLKDQLQKTREDRRLIETFHDDLLNEIMKEAPRCWDGDMSMDALATNYVRHLEALTALGATSTHKPTCEDEEC